MSRRSDEVNSLDDGGAFDAGEREAGLSFSHQRFDRARVLGEDGHANPRSDANVLLRCLLDAAGHHQRAVERRLGQQHRQPAVAVDADRVHVSQQPPRRLRAEGAPR